jgi:hypothetical protein
MTWLGIRKLGRGSDPRSQLPVFGKLARLDDARRLSQCKAKPAEIKVDPTADGIDLRVCWRGFKISRFKIEIGFVNCQDALRNLFQLSQAITNYYILFQRAPKGI